MTTRAKLVALVMAWLSLASACSLYFVRPLPVESASEGYLDCTTSRIPPMVDTLFALTDIAEAIYVGGSDQATHKDAAVAAGLALATVWALSATYGYLKTNQCEDFMAAQGTAMPPVPLWGTSQPQLYPQPPAPAVAPRQVQQPDGGN
ncbi:MAG TPA: hypothetical protein VIK30_11155 [Polyangia bacterium]